MLKLVVVVHHVEKDEVVFEAEKLTAYHDTLQEVGCLIVNDISGDRPKKLGAFANWTYWHYLEE